MARKFMVLFPGESGTLPVKITSTGNHDYNLSLTLNISGLEDEIDGAEYSIIPEFLYLEAGRTASSLLSIESTEDAPTGYYNLRIRANNGGGSKGASLPPLFITAFIPKFIFSCDPTTITTPPEWKTPVYEVVPEEELSVIIQYAHPDEPLILNISASSMIDFEILNNVIETVPVHPLSEPDRFHQIKVKPKLDTPQDKYTIAITGTTGSYTFQRQMILTVKQT